MPVLDVKKYGDPVLRQVAKPIQDGGLTNGFVQDMIETMKVRDGVGLAAPQVGVSKRLIVASDTKVVHVLANPEIIAHSEQTEEDSEGCLSIPGIQGKVPRFVKVIVKGQKPDGIHVEISAKGLLARVFQHEIDHLNGVLFIDRSNPDSLSVLLSNSDNQENSDYRKTNIKEIKDIFEKLHQKSDLKFDRNQQ